MRKCSSRITPQRTSNIHSSDLSVDTFSRNNIKVRQVKLYNLNINQDSLIHPGLKNQQDLIFSATLRFGGAGAINLLN